MPADHQVAQKLFVKMMDIVFLIPRMMDGSAYAKKIFMAKIARRVSLLHDWKIRFFDLLEMTNFKCAFNVDIFKDIIIHWFSQPVSQSSNGLFKSLS